MSVRHAEAVWNGTLREGEGTMRLGSGAYEGQYSYQSRFENGPGSNPEELIGAALAGCFSMAFAGDLGKAGYNPQRVETKAQVYLETVDGKATITRIHLDMEADVPNIEDGAFMNIAEGAKKGCPISRALAVPEITLNAKLIR